MAKQVANRLALIAFGTAVVRGLFIGTDLAAALKDGIAGMALFYALGLLVGELARRIVEENVEASLATSSSEPEASRV